MRLSLVQFHQGYLFNKLIFSKLTGTPPNTPPPLCTLLSSCYAVVHGLCPVSLCTLLVRTKNWPARHLFLYTSPEIKSLSACLEEMCTEKRPLTEAAEKGSIFAGLWECDIWTVLANKPIDDPFFESQTFYSGITRVLGAYFPCSCSIFIILRRFVTKKVTAVWRVMLS